jgi:hypothetical protein
MLLKLIVKLGRMEPLYPMLEEEYDKNHRARYIKAGQVTKIVFFLHSHWFVKCARLTNIVLCHF